MMLSRLSHAALISAALAFACSDPTSAPLVHSATQPTFAISAATTLTPSRLASGSIVQGVNENGDAVGEGPGAVGCGAATSLPKLWHPDGSVVVLPIGATRCGGTALAINNSGYIVGHEYGSGGEFSLWTPNSSGGYTLQEVDYAGHLVRVLGGLNDRGELVGWYNNGEMYWRTTASTSWTLMTSPAGATDCQVRRGINNAGAIVAGCTINGGYKTGYYWANHSATPVALPRPSATGMLYPTEINDAGVIVGFQMSPSKAVRWTPNGAGGYTVAYLPDGGRGAAAYGLARDGTVSGSVVKGNSTNTPVLWGATGGYQVLPYSGSARSGEANDVATLLTGGSVVGGYQDSQAIRWR
jgi:hypothetical protein